MNKFATLIFTAFVFLAFWFVRPQSNSSIDCQNSLEFFPHSQLSQTVLNNIDINNIYVTDINRDSTPDFLYFDKYENKIIALQSSSREEYHKQVLAEKLTTTPQIKLQDINDDGTLDFIIFTNSKTFEIEKQVNGKNTREQKIDPSWIRVFLVQSKSTEIVKPISVAIDQKFSDEPMEYFLASGHNNWALIEFDHSRRGTLFNLNFDSNGNPGKLTQSSLVWPQETLHPHCLMSAMGLQDNSWLLGACPAYTTGEMMEKDHQYFADGKLSNLPRRFENSTWGTSVFKSWGPFYVRQTTSSDLKQSAIEVLNLQQGLWNSVWGKRLHSQLEGSLESMSALEQFPYLALSTRFESTASLTKAVDRHFILKYSAKALGKSTNNMSEVCLPKDIRQAPGLLFTFKNIAYFLNSQGQLSISNKLSEE